MHYQDDFITKDTSQRDQFYLQIDKCCFVLEWPSANMIGLQNII